MSNLTQYINQYDNGLDEMYKALANMFKTLHDAEEEFSIVTVDNCYDATVTEVDNDGVTIDINGCGRYIKWGQFQIRPVYRRGDKYEFNMIYEFEIL